jgi:hypothetical protein
MRHVTPVLSEHGLSLAWIPKQDEKTKEITVLTVLTHVLGHSESVSLTAPPDSSGNKNSIQSIGSTATYLSRYGAILILGLATECEEDDDAGAGAKTRQQAAAKTNEPQNRPVPERTARAIKAFEDRFGITQAQLERAVSKPALQWETAEQNALATKWDTIIAAGSNDPKDRTPAIEAARKAKAKELFPVYPPPSEDEPPPQEREPGIEG